LVFVLFCVKIEQREVFVEILGCFDWYPSFRSLFVFGSIGNFFVFLDRCVFLRPHSVCLLLGVGFLYLWIDHSPFALPFLQFSMEFGVISSQSGRCVKERSLGSNSSAFVFS
jgi:hypothetical protein